MGEEQQLEWICQSVARVDPRANRVVERCQRSAGATLPDAAEIANCDELPTWARNHLRLLCGRELLARNRYDEALAVLEDVSAEQVAAPATLLFCRAVSSFHLLKLEDAHASLKQLAELEECPRRYRELALLMQHDLERFEPNSLDHIARLMRDVERRLGHGYLRGTVRRLEDDVIARLDQLIEQLEQEPGDGPRPRDPRPGPPPPGPGPHHCPGPNGGIQSTRPADASSALPGGAPGNVEPGRIQAKLPWGDLDQADRERILQQVGNRFPSHYRDVIEQYFRKIAE